MRDVDRAALNKIVRHIAQEEGASKEIAGGGTLTKLAYSFDNMSSHIERLLKVQREMINAISHELRTPIARLRLS